MKSNARIAFIVDALPALGGGEKTLFTALEVFPQADIFTLVYNKSAFVNSPIADKKIVTSYLDKLPYAHTRHRLLLPLMPSAIERFDLCKYDVVVSFSYAVAHGVRVNNGTRHISYTYTPMRYAWSDLNIDGTHSRKNPLLDFVMEQFRAWDKNAARRVHEFAAISHGIAGRIQAAYQREARLIYPPVETERFSSNGRRGDYFVTLSRLVPHKRIDLVIEAFARLQLPLKIIGEGPDRKRLQKQATPNIEFLGYQSEEAVARLLGCARGFVCAAEEDFGIAIVEAQAAGCPVIAYKGGGALETVIDGVTGLLFPEQSAASLSEAVKRFEDTAHCLRSRDMLDNAQRFSKGRFTASFQEFVSSVR
ncbi:MAG TPA: glycosyltransferase [Anaerolineales bacterium]|nr:glycosyltransferase [Anaerolineales bacterium]